MFLSLDGGIIPNNSYVAISAIGSTDSTALICYTNRPPPVYGNDNSAGNWFAPDGTRVYQKGFRRNRDPMQLRLIRDISTDPPQEGIYWCDIEDKNLVQHQLYVGLYIDGGYIFSLFIYM